MRAFRGWLAGCVRMHFCLMPFYSETLCYFREIHIVYLAEYCYKARIANLRCISNQLYNVVCQLFPL